ncbi:MAG TPA: DUF4445 domain-containing protein [Dehalococcoidia bacterium]|nr:DUF4445 domain-containing protein [Dehalococcoidia bacterium]
MAKGAKHQPTVIFQPMGRRGHVSDGTTIKEAAHDLGIDIESVCGGRGTCGKCKVRIEEGFSRTESLSPLNEAERKMLTLKQQGDRYRLACQARIHGDLVVFVPEESRTGRQIIRKEAREIAIDLKPAVRKYYVEMVPADLHDNSGDWERLQAELHDRFDLNGLVIDYPVLRDLQNMVRQGSWKVTVSVWMNREVIKIEPGLVANGYGLAVDIGTTTVAAYLCELTTGALAATTSMINPQVAYGEDVMARITYTVAHADGLPNINQAIIRGINQLAGRAAARSRIKRRDIVDMTVVGNTCMHHIFLNLDPQYIGRAPFAPGIGHSLDVKARDLGLEISPGAYVHVLPIEAGFVGADNVGVLIAEEPYHQDDTVLIIDVGTNGELVLSDRHKLVCSSCATGPAFEGAGIKYGMRAAPGAIERIKIDPVTHEVSFKIIGRESWSTALKGRGAKGICGSGIIDAIAQLFTAGVIDQTGRFSTGISSPRLRNGEDGPAFVIAWAEETAIDHDIVVCQRDVRNIQLAKGAMYAGARIMMRRLGVERLDRIILAGAFGSYIDRESAAIIGLFPDCAPENIFVVGNAAGDGARMALLNINKRVEADKVARQVEYIELAAEPTFAEFFNQALWFPHMKDKFPHLKYLLSTPAAE